MRNIVTGTVTGALALVPEVVTIDPVIINESIQILGQVILGIISLWSLIKGLFNKKRL